MGAAKHTPGPWLAQAWNCHALTTVRAGEVTVAECSGHGRHTSESLADARLISAAPDLVDAATYALDVLNQARGKQARLRAIQRLQAAITKATGGDA